MWAIVITVVSSVLLLLCTVYLIIETVARKKRRLSNNVLEANWDIRCAYLMWAGGAALIVGFSFGYYFQLAYDVSTLSQYLWVCLCGVFSLGVTVYLAYNKIIIYKDTGNMAAYGIKITKFNVKDITFLKLTIDTMKGYSQQKRLFTLRERHHDYPHNFYVYIRVKSKCKVKVPKGFCSRDVGDMDDYEF